MPVKRESTILLFWVNSLQKSLLSVFNHTRNLELRDLRKIPNKIQHGLPTIIFFAIFLGIALKSQLFQVSIDVHPCPSVATDDRRQFQCLNMVLNDKTGP